MTSKQDPGQVKRKKTNKKKKHDWSFHVIIISLIVIAIPTVFLGYHILGAASNTGKPIFGNRFKGDLSQKIEAQDLKSVQDKIATIEGVDTVEINLISATVRISMRASESVNKEQFAKIADEAMASLVEKYPIDTYFTVSESEKMYDFEISVYNTSSPTEENPITLYLISKSSASESIHKQYLSDTNDPDFVKELLDNQIKKPSESEGSKEPSTDN